MILTNLDDNCTFLLFLNKTIHEEYMEQITEGTLEFDESEGKFVIANEEHNIIIKNLEFGDEFEVQVEGNWVETALEIGSNDKGEMIFKLRGTPYKEFITGIAAR